MKALLLANDRGATDTALGRNCPAAMLRIIDTPVLEIIIERLQAHGIRQLLIHAGKSYDAISACFGDGRRFGVEIAYSFDGYLLDGRLQEPGLGSAGAIRRIQRESGFFDDTFLVLTADTVVDVDFSALVAAHHARRALATIAVAELPREQRSGRNAVTLTDAGLVSGFRPLADSAAAAATLVDTGVYVFEPAIVGCIGSETPRQIDTHLLPMLVREGLMVCGAALATASLHAGTATNYYRLCQRALQADLPGHSLTGSELAPGLRTGLNVRIDPRRCEIAGPVVIGGGARIEDGAQLIGPCYIGPGSLVAAGARIERSIVLANSRIGDAANLCGVVTDGEFCIAGNDSVINLRRALLPWVIGDARAHEASVRFAEQRFLDAIA